MTCSAIHDTLYRKSHRACRGNAPPSCCARPLCRLKAPLGLSLLRKRGLVEKYRTARIYSPWRFLPPRNTPDQFCRRFTRQNHRCAAWAVFFFFTNKILCSCSIFQNLFLVVDCTTAKCYSCAWKKQVVVSALTNFRLKAEETVGELYGNHQAIIRLRRIGCKNHFRDFF